MRSAIEGAQLFPNNESEMQRQLAALFASAGIIFEREKRLSDGERLDFFIEGVAVEVKMRSHSREVVRQLKRYAELPEVNGIVLIARTPVVLPSLLSGKPVYGVFTWRQAIA